MKKKIIIMVMAISLLMAGCKKEGLNFTPNANWDTKWHTIHERHLGHIVPYQNGFYHIAKPDCLAYYDINSGQSVILCDKNGCSHEDKTCFAYIESPFDMPEIHNDKLYFISCEGDVSVANADNTEKKKKFTLLKDIKEKEAVVFVTEFIMTDDYLFFLARVTEYSGESGEKTEDRVYALDLESKKETLITAVEREKQHVRLISAYKNILYYVCSDNVFGQSVDMEWTEKELKQMEKNEHTELYRKEMEENDVEKIIEVDNGWLMAATDDFGVYYTEFAGTGYNSSSKLFHVKPGETNAELAFSTDDPNGFSYGDKNAEYMWITVGDKHTIYALDTMEPVEMEWEYPNQSGYAYPVPGGFAVPKVPWKTGESRDYLGEDYKVLRMQTGIYQ